MNTLFLATAGLAAAVDFFFVTIVTGISVLGLMAGLLGWRLKTLWLAALGGIPAVLAIIFTAAGLHYALTVPPEEDIDAAGYAPLWRIGLIISTTCFIGAILCIVMIRRSRRPAQGTASSESP